MINAGGGGGGGDIMTIMMAMIGKRTLSVNE